jgi:hypothetical protein
MNLKSLIIQCYANQRSNKHIVLLFAFAILLSFNAPTSAQQDKPLKENNDRVNALMRAVESGEVAYKLTGPNEIKALLGNPQKENQRDGGGMIALDMMYQNIVLWYGKSKDEKAAAFKLLSVEVNGKAIDLGGSLQGERQIVVRSIDDFHEMEIENLNLKNLDLSGEGDYLKGVEFDSLTQWPSSDKLPPGFDPRKMLEEGKNPGLGIRALHEEGINGEDVGIAILDQPLLLGHEEYTSRLLRYDNIRASWLSPRSHGSPIMGIATGKTCGVAPGAFVFYYAAMTTCEHRIQADWIDEIIKHNETVKGNGFMGPKRIRVISISAAPENESDNAAYMKARKRAMDAGILVVTCSKKFFHYGALTLIEGKDPDKPESYKGGGVEDVLLIPTRNKTIASYQGNNVYTISRGIANSWAPPYIAGLAALAFQVNPDLQPQAILDQLVKTATHTKAGPVVNPRKFIESIRPTAFGGKK